MPRHCNILGLLLGLPALLCLPVAASAQPHPAHVNAVQQAHALQLQNAHALQQTPVFNNNFLTNYNAFANTYLGSGLAARAYYNNAYLNNALGNAYSSAARNDSFLLNNGLFSNVNTTSALQNAYLSNATAAQAYYTNAQ